MNKHLKKCLWVGFSLLLFSSLALPSHASYQCLRLDGNGYASIADVSQAGLNMGLSDFIIEARAKVTNTGTVAGIVSKFATTGYYLGYDQDSQIRCKVRDATTDVVVSSGIVNIFDGRWYYIVMVADRSDAATGLKLYLDGSYIVSGQLGTATCDTSEEFRVGAVIDLRTVGFIDCVRVWNFGKNGLPADYAAYIAWRAQGRNVFKDISQYNSGSWNGYADADRLERLTYGALDDDNSDFEGAGVDGTDISVGTDWVKSNTAAEIDDEAGSGVNAYNGSTYCCKIHTATDEYPAINLYGANLDAGFTVGKFYEITFDYKVQNCTIARFKFRNVGATTEETITLTSTSWTTARKVFQLVGNNDVMVTACSHYSTNQSGDEVLWVDNISIKEIGKVGHWKFEGDYLDEGSNGNTLSEGGSGNVCGLGYTLKKEKIIGPAWVR